MSGEVGIAPLSMFKSHQVVGRDALGWGIGIVFNANTPDDLGGMSMNAYWPINAMLGASKNLGLFGKNGMLDRFMNHKGWNALNNPYDHLLALSRHNVGLKPVPTYPGGGFKKYHMPGNPGTLYFSTPPTLDFTDGATIIGYQNRTMNFGTTFSYNSKPRDLFSDITSLPDGIRNSLESICNLLLTYSNILSDPGQSPNLFSQVIDLLPEQI